MTNGVGPWFSSWTLWIPLFGFLAAAVAWDLHRRRVPNFLVVALAVFGLGANLWFQPVGPALMTSAVGLLAGFSMWFLPYLFKMAGAADLKLAAAIGVWLGPLGVVRASVYAALVGGALALLWLVRFHGLIGGYVYLRTMSLNPAAAARTGNRSPSMRTIPYALALAAGVVCELLRADAFGGLR